jgi:hypothetical protein
MPLYKIVKLKSDLIIPPVANVIKLFAAVYYYFL